jgi:hypothetical protein
MHIRYFFLVCAVLACMGFTSKDYFQKREIAADESAFVFRRVPGKIIPINDSLLVFHTDNKIMFSNYHTGKIKHLLNAKEIINRKYIMKKYLKIDTTDKVFRVDDSIFLHGGIPPIQLLSMAKNSDSDIFLVCAIYTFRMKIHGEDTLLDPDPDVFSALLNYKNFSIKKIRPFDLQWADTFQMFRTPQDGLGIVNNTIYVPYDREPSDPRKILCAYSMKNLTMTDKQPGILHTVFEKAEKGVSLPTFYNFQDIDSGHYVNNVTKIYNLLTEKELFDCKNYFRHIYFTSFYSPIDKEKRKWFIGYSSLPDTVNYHSKINQLQPWIYHIAVIDIVDKQVLYDTTITDYAIFYRYKNSIISIEHNKSDKKYYYVTYNL